MDERFALATRHIRDTGVSYRIYGEVIERTWPVNPLPLILGHDEWTQMMIKTGKYKSSEIYPSPKDPALKQQYEDFKKKKMSEMK